MWYPDSQTEDGGLSPVHCLDLSLSPNATQNWVRPLRACPGPEFYRSTFQGDCSELKEEPNN